MPVTTETDNYLLSKQHIEALRNQAREQRQLRERLSQISIELNNRLQKDKDNPLFSKRVNKLDELIRDANELAAALQRAELEGGLEDSKRTCFTEALQTVSKSAKLLVDAKNKASTSQRSEAEILRMEARNALRNEADKMAKVFPGSATQINPKTFALTQSLLKAEAAMRQIEAMLKESPDRLAVEKQMRAVAELLKSAYHNRMSVLE
jgi:hypothetical protein